MRFIVVVAAAVVAVLAEDECSMPPPTGQKMVGPGECCAAGESIGTKFKDSAMKCMQKYPKPERPQGPRPTGPPPTPTPEMKNRHACMEECVYTEAGVVTADKMLDQAALTKMFSDAGPMVKAAVEKCSKTYKSEIDQTLECKSGAHEFNRCISREVFLSCPSDKWTSSTECEDLKTRVTKCPMMPVHLGRHKH